MINKSGENGIPFTRYGRIINELVPGKMRKLGLLLSSDIMHLQQNKTD
jgi:hypothetical protein